MPCPSGRAVGGCPVTKGLRGPPKVELRRGEAAPARRSLRSDRLVLLGLFEVPHLEIGARREFLAAAAAMVTHHAGRRMRHGLEQVRAGIAALIARFRGPAKDVMVRGQPGRGQEAMAQCGRGIARLKSFAPGAAHVSPPPSSYDQNGHPFTISNSPLYSLPKEAGFVKASAGINFALLKPYSAVGGPRGARPERQRRIVAGEQKTPWTRRLVLRTGESLFRRVASASLQIKPRSAWFQPTK